MAENDKVQSIIRRLRSQLPPGATIVEESDLIIFRAPGQKPVFFGMTGTCQELEDLGNWIIETAKAVSFEKEVQ